MNIDTNISTLNNLRSRIKDVILSDQFVSSYVDTAMWASADEEGCPLDEVYDEDDIHFDSLVGIALGCLSFRQISDELSTRTPAQDAHDFYLSRNGHGAGFFDRFDETSEVLQSAAKPFGTDDLYVGDDNLIHSTQATTWAPDVLSVLVHFQSNL